MEPTNDNEVNELLQEFANAGFSVTQISSTKANAHTYTTKSGFVFTLRPISAVLIQQFKNNMTGKPQPPVVEVTIGNRKTKQVNPDDPDYIAELKQFQTDQQNTLMKYLFTRGIVDKVPKEDQERLREFLPLLSDTEVKYMWVLEQLSPADSEAEFGILVSAIMGQTVATAEGIAQAEAGFRRDGERESDQQLSSTENSHND